MDKLSSDNAGLNPPPGPTRGVRLDEVEADRIAAVYDVRSYPAPPDELLSERPEDYHHYNELLERAATPHWNAAVELLRSGADGYLALVRLRDRLSGHVAGIIHEADQRSIRASIARSVGRILSCEAERHGPDTEIGTALDGRPPSTDVEEWSWEPRRSWGQEEGDVVPYSPPAYFALRSSYLDALVSASESEHRDTFVEVQRDWTWARALIRASSTELRFSRPPLDPGTDVIDLARFRLKVVEQVLREHELLGHVEEFDTRTPRRAELSEEMRTFLDAALAAILAVENEDRPSWNAVRSLMEVETGWSGSKIERVAEDRFAAFEKRKGTGSGPLPRPEERERYDRFSGQIRRWAEAAGVPGGTVGG